VARWLHKGWYQPIQPYEKLRIHLRPFGPLGREKPKRARNLGLRPFDPQHRLLDLAIRAATGTNSGRRFARTILHRLRDNGRGSPCAGLIAQELSPDATASQWQISDLV
jgi:hypothetical protein